MQQSTLYLQSIGLDRGRVRSFGEYPFSLPAVRTLDEIEIRAPVTFLVGENGSGKSTLLEAIASSWGFNPEGGSRNMMFATRPSESGLHEYLSLRRGYKRPGGRQGGTQTSRHSSTLGCGLAASLRSSLAPFRDAAVLFGRPLNPNRVHRCQIPTGNASSS